MVLLGLLLLFTSIKDLALHNTAVGVGASLVVSLFGAAASFALYKWKMYYGHQLQSIVVLTDAKCSRCVGCISVSVVLALVLQQVRALSTLNILLS
jgi:divalent metal cation (Fe/Co/Zn/Cd) transporter